MPKRTLGGRQVRMREAACRCLPSLLAAALTVFIASGAAAGAAAPSTAQPSTSSPDLLRSLALQQAEWLDPGAAANDYFGYSVALSGDTALVGAYQRDSNGKLDSGAVYVFVRSGAGWSQQTVLVPADAAAGDNFGWSVALSGDTALVGAYNKAVGAAVYAGAAYVFTRSGSTWSQQAELTATAEAASDFFGSSVALSGDTALIGADQRTVNGKLGAGAAYVFTGSGATWSQQAELTANDAATNDTFGCAVALSGDTAMVGAYDKAVGAAVDAGAAYVFVRSGATWSSQAELTDPDPKTNDGFGCAVALSGDTALVGAVQKPIAGRSYVGAAYTYTRLGTGWAQQADLVASGAGACDGFGGSVALSGDVALVGAYGAGLPTQAGSASVFVRSGTSWSQYALLLVSDAAAGDNFGLSVALSGGTAVVGAPFKSIGGVAAAGCGYAYLLDGTAPVTTATGLQALSTGAWQKIPAQVSLSAADNAGGVGLAATYYTIDGGAQQTYAAPFTLADGAHTVSYWSVDKVGNVETAHSGYANIDTKAPTATAKAMMLKAVKAKKGKTLRFRLTVADPTPSCGSATLTLTLTTKKGKKLWSLVKVGQPTNKALTISYKLKKTLKKGTYSIVCRSTDAAGNVQAKVAKAKLKIT